jgi:hypothetical protein
MKKVLSISTLFLALTLMSPSFAAAEEQVCTQGYGQAVVCRSVPVHTPVQAGLGDVSIVLVAFSSLSIGLVLFIKSKKFANS